MIYTKEAGLSKQRAHFLPEPRKEISELQLIVLSEPNSHVHTDYY